MLFPKKMVKIICVVLAALMLLSGVAVLLQVFAADSALLAVSPSTGESDLDKLVPIIVIVAAVMAVLVCLLLPKFKKKSQ